MKTFCLGILSIGLLQAGSITVIDLGGFGGASGTGYRINDAGTVVGWAQTVSGDNHAFVTTGNGVLNDLNGTASESLAYGVNNAGSVVGTSYSGGQVHGTWPYHKCNRRKNAQVGTTVDDHGGRC